MTVRSTIFVIKTEKKTFIKDVSKETKRDDLYGQLQNLLCILIIARLCGSNFVD